MTAAVAALAAAGVTALLVNIFERKQEARETSFRVVELNDEIDDAAVWGKNFPFQYDSYLRTVDQTRTRYGGSEAIQRTPTGADPRSIVAQSRLEEDPRLKTMWNGYAFAVDFREERGTRTCLRTRRSPNARTWSPSPARACTVMRRCICRTSGLGAAI